MCSALSLVVWLIASLKVCKILLFIVGALMTCCVLLLFFFISPDWPIEAIYLVFGLRGVTVSATYLFPLSLLPDIIEFYYTLHTDRREATFYSIMSFVEKIGIAFSFLISSLILGFTGFTNAQTGSEDYQPDSTIFALRFLVSVCPLFFSFISMIFGCFYYIVVEKRGKNLYFITSYSDSEIE